MQNKKVKNQVQHNFNRFASSYNEYAIVQQEIAKRLFNRLEIISAKHPIKNILELGSGTGLLTDFLLEKYQQYQIFATDIANKSLYLNPAECKICLNSHNICLKNNYFDVIMSNLMMQWCDLNTVITQTTQVLKNNGLFLFSTFGPQTLIELKQSWQGVDNHQHISEFIDMHNIGDKMLGLGFKDVVVESEIITLTYEKVMDLLLDLKHIGAQNINATTISKSALTQMIDNYENFRVGGKIPASYEVIYAHGYKNSIN